METMETMNNNIQEQRVSFDNAKRLQEKGFDCKVDYYFVERDQYDLQGEEKREVKHDEAFHCDVKRPTQQLVLDWILVNFKLHVRIDWFDTYDDSIEWDYSIQEVGINFDDNGNPAYLRAYDPEISFKTPEEAKEAAISFVLA